MFCQVSCDITCLYEKYCLDKNNRIFIACLRNYSLSKLEIAMSFYYLKDNFMPGIGLIGFYIMVIDFNSDIIKSHPKSIRISHIGPEKYLDI